MRDYYKVLEVPPNATANQLKTSYRKLVRQYHPDYNRDDKVAEEMLKMINEAYAILSDPRERAVYDQTYFGRKSQTSTRKATEERHYEYTGVKTSKEIRKKGIGETIIAVSKQIKRYRSMSDIPTGRFLSLIIAAGYVFSGFMSENSKDGYYMGIYAFISLMPIWFGDQLGAMTGFTGSGMYIDTPTPGFLVRLFGWIFLLMPCVIHVVYYLNGWEPLFNLSRTPHH